jgi:hypothetical protein
MEFNVRSLKEPVTRSEEGGLHPNEGARPSEGGADHWGSLHGREEGGATAMARRHVRRKQCNHRLGEGGRKGKGA